MNQFENNNTQAVGVFDSGVGGLSVCQAIRQVLPNEDIIYFADDEFSPYGTKSQEQIDQRTKYIVQFLISHGCKALVIACNTATVTSIAKLREEFSIPIVGVEPGIKPAALLSETKKVGVLATEQTTKTESFQKLKLQFDHQVEINVTPCPEFVTLVEALEHDSPQANEVSSRILRPLMDNECDQVVLGCTHFSFMKPVLSKILGEKVNIIDTGLPVARQLANVLHAADVQTGEDKVGRYQFWTSGNTSKLALAVERFLDIRASVFKV